MSTPKFTPPKDYTAPEGIADGDTFEVPVTLKKEGDKLCLVEIDGMPMPGYEKEAAKGKKANAGEADAAVQADFAQRYATAMQGAAQEPQ